MRRIPVVFLLAVVALLTLAAPAWAHTELSSTAPAADASPRNAPDAVTLTFTQEVDERLATVTVRGPGGAIVSTGQPQRDGLALVQPVQDAAAGRYQVEWRAAAGDGHILRGSYAFRVGGGGTADAPAATAPSSERPSPEDYLRDHAKRDHAKPSYAITAADRRRAKKAVTPAASAAASADAPAPAPADAVPVPDNGSATIVTLLAAALGVTTVTAVIESVRAHRV